MKDEKCKAFYSDMLHDLNKLSNVFLRHLCLSKNIQAQFALHPAFQLCIWNSNQGFTIWFGPLKDQTVERQAKVLDGLG